ncbi:MAG: hypothetical protein ACRDCE_19905 [Cetobacterium sp.]|uniref:hypothetical protein n=1 Tax=Cetobacterium sp. TaxID=2071632 RepID=UPI003EE45D81
MINLKGCYLQGDTIVGTMTHPHGEEQSVELVSPKVQVRGSALIAEFEGEKFVVRSWRKCGM